MLAETATKEQARLPIILPNALNNNNGECTVLVQIDPADSSTLDFVGATGAIGRMEADSSEVRLDFKGCKYRGRLYPAATALVLSVVQNNMQQQQQQKYLKVDGITDEFCRLTKTGNALVNAVTVGDYQGYEQAEDNVNRKQSVVVQEEKKKKSSAKKRIVDAAASAGKKKKRAKR